MLSSPLSAALKCMCARRVLTCEVLALCTHLILTVVCISGHLHMVQASRACWFAVDACRHDAGRWCSTGKAPCACRGPATTPSGCGTWASSGACRRSRCTRTASGASTRTTPSPPSSAAAGTATYTGARSPFGSHFQEPVWRHCSACATPIRTVRGNPKVCSVSFLHFSRCCLQRTYAVGSGLG